LQLPLEVEPLVQVRQELVAFHRGAQVLGPARDQVRELADDVGEHQDQEQRDDHQAAEQSQRHRPPAGDPPALEPRERRLEAERQDQGHQDQDQDGSDRQGDPGQTEDDQDRHGDLGPVGHRGPARLGPAAHSLSAEGSWNLRRSRE
jgi:hypothetical protein